MSVVGNSVGDIAGHIRVLSRLAATREQALVGVEKPGAHGQAVSDLLHCVRLLQQLRLLLTRAARKLLRDTRLLLVWRVERTRRLPGQRWGETERR